MDQAISGQDVIIQEKGPIGHIILNRPHALNALNLDMIRNISIALSNWANKDNIKAIFIEGAGEKAFCAGGDIKSFYSIGMDYRRGKVSLDVAMLYFKEEYELNSQIFHYSKPVISFMHGITMGGGFGIGGHAQYKIACDNTKFAMPEAKIGFFPDIGSMYHLTRLPHSLGMQMILTGDPISGEEMKLCGLAGFITKSQCKADLLDALVHGLDCTTDINNDDLTLKITRIIEDFEYDLPLDKIKEFNEKLSALSKVYSGKSLVGIIDALNENTLNPQYQTDAKSIKANAPDSLSVAYHYYNRAMNKDFDWVISQDLILATNFAKGPDFYEGIRAAVLDKDKAPHWHRKNHIQVSDNDFDVYFMK